jgi:hypothetical protein
MRFFPGVKTPLLAPSDETLAGRLQSGVRNAADTNPCDDRPDNPVLPVFGTPPDGDPVFRYKYS